MTPTAVNRRDQHQSLILKAAISSRLLLLSLILLWRAFVQPYDTSAPLNPDCLAANTAAVAPPPPPSSAAIPLPGVASAIESSVVWDSVYFVRIAECGYEYEQTYAFLPLLPACISLLSRTLFAPLVSIIGLRAVLALSGYAVNNLAFVAAAVYFYRVSIIILGDADAALRASILFCFNPASIFYSSIYTESLYSLFSLGGLYYLITGASNVAVLCFALSASARSNGVLNAGYFCFQTMHLAYDAVFVKRHACLAARVLIVGALRCVCTFLPFVAFQAYGYYNICHGRSPDKMSPWCKGKVPLLYNYIQSHYWGVGFLRYFQLKQLPNFMLASPILSLALCSILHYVRSQPEIFLSLSFRASNEEKRIAASWSSPDTLDASIVVPSKEKSSSKRQGKFSLSMVVISESAATYDMFFNITMLLENRQLRQRKQMKEEDDHVSLFPQHASLEKPGYLSAFIFPCTLHLGFMSATAFFIMHVQVATRFLSASPPLYWFACRVMISPHFSRRWGHIIWAYSIAYILLGSLLFSNFYPFT
ncbi:hypothetical protein Tsubulata_014998 [Turnera subulata]|uniref:GPI mannosyltransferase 2 n=1 Tax=Turnera subulata TaxID=218843 RepID=A0A9Q0F608_9ROSI|nr:hypothetical protein Tsubulata_014998 [Turnera subulata]